MRLLFLTMLILAFAQPYLPTGQQKSGSRLQAIYIDNSGSMSLKKDAQRLLDIARQTAIRQVKKAPPGTRFLLLTNNRPSSYKPMPADKVLAELNNIELSSLAKNAEQVISLVQDVAKTELTPAADLYYYSDFQQGSVAVAPSAADNIHIYAIQLKGSNPSNIYIDTAYLSSPVLQAGTSNELIVRTKLYGTPPDQPPVLNMLVNGQVKSAATIQFDGDNIRTDTLNFSVNDAGWQKIELVVNDETVRFDDTFRITARSTPNLSVLALNEGSPSPYIQAAFRAYNGFRLNNVPVDNAPEDWSEYSLVLLHNVTRISSNTGRRLAKALQAGQTIFILPGKTGNVAALNEGLKELSEIIITGIDTAAQPATALQQGSELVSDLFESIPENVQLPMANWHYTTNAGLIANRQAILSFRNGDPYLAQYRPSAGKLYLLSGGIDLQSGNFPTSYFFAPFLYQMAVQAQGGNVYALTLGKRQPAYLPLNNANERNMVHLHNNGTDAIPPQRTYGAGLNVMLDGVVEQGGFYELTAAGKDTVVIATNADRAESILATTDAADLEDIWKDVEITVANADTIGTTGGRNTWGSFPLWKVCAILALIMLAAETWLLAGSLRKPTAATQ